MNPKTLSNFIRVNGLTTGCLIALCLFTATVSFAQKKIPELWGLRVHDEARVLSQSVVDKLEAELKQIEDSTTNQIAILIIPSLDGANLEEYSLQVAEKWKLGTAKNDNGVLILIVVDDHKVRIEVGQGLEGVLTDALSNRIIRNEMAPNFRKGDYNAGVLAAVRSIDAATRGEYAADDAGSSGEMDLATRFITGIFIFVVLGIFTLIALYSQGCFGWGLYAFLIIFYAVFPWIAIGWTAALVLLAIYVVGMPIAKIYMQRSTWGREQLKSWQKRGGGSGSGSGWSMGSGWGSSGGGFGGGGGFSGGGGSFGGGGSSGSW